MLMVTNNSNQCINLNEYIPLVVHAAVSAIINKTRESVEGCTMYVTQCPEKDCIHAILLGGIKEVVYRKIDDSDDEQLRVKTAKIALGNKLR